MNLHPKNDYLMLQAMKENAVSKGGIIIPESHRKDLSQGIILEVGNDVVNGDYDIGEIVIFPLHVEYRVETDETTILFVKAQDILGGDDGEQARSEGGVEDLKRIKSKPQSVLPPSSEKRTPIGRCICGVSETGGLGDIHPDCPLHGVTE